MRNAMKRNHARIRDYAFLKMLMSTTNILPASTGSKNSRRTTIVKRNLQSGEFMRRKKNNDEMDEMAMSFERMKEWKNV